MARTKRAIFLKQSGELLDGGQGGSHWQAAKQVAANLAQAHAHLAELNVGGLTVVTGAGNLARGAEFRAQGVAKGFEDVLGRWGTIGNAISLASALQELGMDTELFIAANMAYKDPQIELKTYSSAALQQAHQEGKLAIIAGGTGEDNVTTDNAVVTYAQQFREVYSGPILVLKSTKFDGVYQSDPAKAGEQLPMRYSKIGAGFMLANYQQFSVVDKASLEQLQASGLSMLVYAESKHSLESVLGQAQIGTLILPGNEKPQA